MAGLLQKRILRNAALKNKEGLGSPVQVGASFEDIFDTRAGSQTDNKIYSLAQFFDSYLNFVKNLKTIYVSNADDSVNRNKVPSNPNCAIWIDTYQTNHESYGEK